MSSNVRHTKTKIYTMHVRNNFRDFCLLNSNKIPTYLFLYNKETSISLYTVHSVKADLVSMPFMCEKTNRCIILTSSEVCLLSIVHTVPTHSKSKRCLYLYKWWKEKEPNYLSIWIIHNSRMKKPYMEKWKIVFHLISFSYEYEEWKQDKKLNTWTILAY